MDSLAFLTALAFIIYMSGLKSVRPSPKRQRICKTPEKLYIRTGHCCDTLKSTFLVSLRLSRILYIESTSVCHCAGSRLAIPPNMGKAGDVDPLTAWSHG